MKTESSTVDIFLCGFNQNFYDFTVSLFDFDTEMKKPHYDIAAIGEKGFADRELLAQYIICPFNITVNGIISCDNVLTCGMDSKSTLSFTSIGYGTALLSVNRRINFFEQSYQECEKPVDFYKKLTVYENLALQGLRLLAW